MLKQEVVQHCYDSLSAIISPVCVANGLSFKTMPGDLDAGTIRTAMAVLFVPGFSDGSPANLIASRRSGLAKVQAYVLVLAASQVGPRSATWACSVILEALDGQQAYSMSVSCDQMQLSSFKDGIWQYRLPLTVTIPISTGNSEVHADTAWVETW